MTAVLGICTRGSLTSDTLVVAGSARPPLELVAVPERAADAHAPGVGSVIGSQWVAPSPRPSGPSSSLDAASASAIARSS